jgi:hypothetical protein
MIRPARISQIENLSTSHRHLPVHKIGDDSARKQRRKTSPAFYVAASATLADGPELASPVKVVAVIATCFMPQSS